jgi:WD40 repeat protein
VYGLAISPSGKILATGGKESSICLWQLPECSIIDRFTAHSGWVRGLQFVDENTLVSIGSEGICKLWRLSHDLPLVTPFRNYKSTQEVIDEYRRPLDSDDE